MVAGAGVEVTELEGVGVDEDEDDAVEMLATGIEENTCWQLLI